MSTAIDFGHFPLGSSPTFTFLFKQTGTLTDPGVSPVLNVTEDGVKTTKSLAHPSAGTYTWNPLLNVAGFYSATIYAPPGSGEAAQPFTFVVDPDPNYP